MSSLKLLLFFVHIVVDFVVTGYVDVDVLGAVGVFFVDVDVNSIVSLLLTCCPTLVCDVFDVSDVRGSSIIWIQSQ